MRQKLQQHGPLRDGLQPVGAVLFQLGGRLGAAQALHGRRQAGGYGGDEACREAMWGAKGG